MADVFVCLDLVFSRLIDHVTCISGCCTDCVSCDWSCFWSQLRQSVKVDRMQALLSIQDHSSRSSKQLRVSSSLSQRMKWRGSYRFSKDIAQNSSLHMLWMIFDFGWCHVAYRVSCDSQPSLVFLIHNLCNILVKHNTWLFQSGNCIWSAVWCWCWFFPLSEHVTIAISVTATSLT